MFAFSLREHKPSTTSFSLVAAYGCSKHHITLTKFELT